MKVGDNAEVTRSFSKKDLLDYAAVSGYEASAERVPEPLIGALFSYLLGVKLPGMGTMYLKQETTFLKDALIGKQLSAKVEITRLRPEKYLADLTTICRDSDGQIVANGHALVYIRDVASNHDEHE